MKETPTKLRHALRLTHCLQKERGASASHYAYSISHPLPSSLSGIGASLASEYNGDFFSLCVIQARQDTNVAFAMLDNVKGWVDSLERVRNKIDQSCFDSSPPGQQKTTFIGAHRVIVMYNILIGNIIDERVIQVIVKQLQILNQEHGPADNPKPIVKHERHRSQVFKRDHSPADYKTRSSKITTMPMARSMPMTCADDVFKNHPPANILKKSVDDTGYPNDEDPEHLEHPCNSVDKFDSRIKPARMPPTLLSENYGLHGDKIHMNGNGTKDPSAAHQMDLIGIEYAVPISQLLPPAAPAEPRLQSDALTPSLSPLAITKESTVEQVRNLLSLLLSFIGLKESTGCERAILCCLMALSSDEDSSKRNSTSKLFNDLVVEEANQRRIVRELQTQSKNIQRSGLSLLGMVEKFLRPGREMEDVQDMIKDFDLKGLQHSMPLKDFWEIITLYIDQLHALELLIVEELGMSCMELSMTMDQEGNAEVEVVNRKESTKELIMSIVNARSKNLTETEAIQELARMPPEKVKDILLRHIQGDDLTNLSEITEGSNEDKISSLAALMQPTETPSPSLKEWEIDLYEIEFRQRIGRGVGGTTYLAKWSGQQVAVKVAAITDLGLEGWYTEVHSLKRLHHPNVIRLLGSIYNPSPQTYGLVLEYCNSGDLSAALHRPTPANFFWKVADDLASGMSYLHRKQILHRDIKPANILLDGDVAGGNFTAKLTDFGVAIMHQGPAGEEHTAETG